MSKTIFRRSEFVGRTDVYSPAVQNGQIASSLDVAIRGVRPINVVAPVTTGYGFNSMTFGSEYCSAAETRLIRYREYWDFYMGKQFTVEVDGNISKVPVNFCRKAVKKRAVWAAGKSLQLQSVAGNEYVTEVLSDVWKFNGGKALLRSIVRTGLVTGDAFLMFNVVKTDATGKELPRDKWKVAVVQLNPSFCYPVWNETDPCKMAAIMIQFPAVISTKADEVPSERLFTQIITATRVQKYVDLDIISDEPNSLGLINIVHFSNEAECSNLFGTSLVSELIPLNKAYNETFHSIRRVCNYHGEPATIVYGVRLSQMERGAGKVWSGLPGENKSKVENLMLNDDLTAMYKCLAETEQQIYHQARTPKICYDSEGLAISNTSGVAMSLLFQPLVEATIETQDKLREVVALGNAIIYQIHKVIFNENLAALADEPERALDCIVEFESILPRDEAAFLDMAIKRRDSKAWSQAEFIRRVSQVQDTERLAVELAADTRAEHADSLQKARALQGQPFNPTAAFLGSPFLSEDLLDVATQIPASSDTTDNGNGGD